MSTRRRRRKQQLQMTLIATISIILLFVILFFQLSSHTVIGSKDINRTYISVKVLEDDTLWDLGNEFLNDEYYAIDEFIYEIIEINGLKSETIYPGQRLTIPVFDQELAALVVE